MKKLSAGSRDISSISVHRHASFSFSMAIGSTIVRQDHYGMVKTMANSFMISPHGIDSIFLDIPMHCIKIKSK